MPREITIGIDGNEANQKIRVGSGVYAFELLKQFEKFQKSPASPGTGRANIKYQIYLKNTPITDLPKESSTWRYVIIAPKSLWTQIGLPIELWREKMFGRAPDIFFTPTHYAPRFSPSPSVISIMDLSFIHFPEMFNKKDLWQLKNWTGYSVKNAKKIITISNFSKKDIITYYGVNPEKVVVTYPGYDNKKFNPDIIGTKSKIKEKYKIDGEYILFVGTLQPRKNIAQLIEAFKIAMKQFNNETMKLIVVGKKGWLYEEIFQKVKELRIEKRIIFTDYVKEEELPDLYRSAKCLVLPSLHEGFGIPVIEAMACGCPVVVSNVSSLPEIVESAGVFVDPYRIESIAEGINQVCYDEANRNKLIKKGLLQVKKFTWQKCAEETYNSIVKIYD